MQARSACEVGARHACLVRWYARDAIEAEELGKANRLVENEHVQTTNEENIHDRAEGWPEFLPRVHDFGDNLVDHVSGLLDRLLGSFIPDVGVGHLLGLSSSVLLAREGRIYGRGQRRANQR